MATRTMNPVNVVGSMAPQTAEYSALRSNRLMQAVQEAGATQRQREAARAQMAVTGMQEQGAMARTQAGEAGAGERAQLQAATTREGQQLQAQVGREQIASGERQNVAMMAANRELAQLREDGLNVRSTLDRDQDDARHRERMALLNKQLDIAEAARVDMKTLTEVQNMTYVIEQGQNRAVLERIAMKKLGNEIFLEKQKTLQKHTRDNWMSSVQTNKATTDQLDYRLSKDTASVLGRIDELFTDLTTYTGTPMALDDFEPANLSKLETTVEAWTPTQQHAVLQTLRKLRERTVEEKKTAKPPIKRTVTYGGGPGLSVPPRTVLTPDSGAHIKQLESYDTEIERLDNAIRVLTYDLTKSERKASAGDYTIGKHVRTLNMFAEGLHADAAEARALMAYPDDPGAFSRMMLNLIQNPDTFDENDLIILYGDFYEKMSPAGKVMLRQVIKAQYGSLFRQQSATPSAVQGWMGVMPQMPSYDVPER